MTAAGSNRWLAAVNVAIYAYLLAPLAVVVLFSFSDRSFFVFPPRGFSLAWYGRAWETGLFLRPALLSIALGLAAAAVAGLFAIPAVLALRRAAGRSWARIVETALLAPLIVPALIIGIALLYTFSRLRLIDSLAGLLAAHVLIVFPFMFRAVLTSAYGLKRQHEEASDILGASPWQTFRAVTLPQLRGGIAAGALFSFIISFDQFTVSLFVTQSDAVTLPVAIYKYLYDVNDPVAAAVSTILVALGLAATMAVQRAGWLDQVGRAGA